jgi:hypothetical protein
MGRNKEKRWNVGTGRKNTRIWDGRGDIYIENDLGGHEA